MFNMFKMFKRKKVFNKQTGIMKVKTINGKDYCFVPQRGEYFEIIKSGKEFKIYGFFLNLAGELTVEYI